MDEQLCQLIREVLKHRDGSDRQKQAMNRLLELIPRLPGIYRPSDRRINYQDIFNQALISLSIYGKQISKHNLRQFIQKCQININTAEATFVRRSLVSWFNGILRNKINERYRQLKKEREEWSIDALVSNQDCETTTFAEITSDPRTSGDIEAIIQREQNQKTRRKGMLLELYIELDPEGKLRDCYHKGRGGKECRECNCQLLFQELHLTPEESKIRIPDIARRFDIHQQTIYTRLLPRCRKILREIELEIDNNLDYWTRKLLGE